MDRHAERWTFRGDGKARFARYGDSAVFQAAKAGKPLRQIGAITITTRNAYGSVMSIPTS
jgi:hypothetical protein